MIYSSSPPALFGDYSLVHCGCVSPPCFMLFAFLITRFQRLPVYQNTEGSIHRKKCDTSISWALLSQLPQNFPSLSWACFFAVRCAVFFDRCVLPSGIFVPEGMEIRAQEHMLYLHQLCFGTFPRVKRPYKTRLKHLLGPLHVSTVGR